MFSIARMYHSFCAGSIDAGSSSKHPAFTFSILSVFLDLKPLHQPQLKDLVSPVGSSYNDSAKFRIYYPVKQSLPIW